MLVHIKVIKLMLNCAMKGSHVPRRVVAERLIAPDSSSDVSDQQSVGSSPGHCIALFVWCKVIGPMRFVTHGT